MPDRRAFLRRALALAWAGFALPGCAPAVTRPRFRAYPFTLGIASGSPTASGVVLWTRLAPDPLHGGGLDPEDIAVRWEVAEDERFSRIVREGTAVASATRAHAVHAEAEGLAPGRDYHYRFLAGGEASAVGRTRTAPAPGPATGRLRLALASCQHWEHGFYAAHRHLAAEAPDLVAFVGDYIYEGNGKANRVRDHHIPEPRTLAAYRDRYAQYKTDPDLQAAHACAPWIVTWDDHEADNDYANDRSQDLDPAFLARRAAAYRAFLEHQPLRPGVERTDGEFRLYGTHAWGSLASIHVLDDRQYRAWQACPPPGRGGSRTVGADCEERARPGRTMLGDAQERWLDGALRASRSRWNLLAQQTLMANAGRPAPGGRQHWTDGWDGYPWARERLFGSLQESGVANPVVLGGDVHAHYAANLHARPGDAGSPVIAAEFCGTSISSRGLGMKAVNAIREANPPIRFADSSRRGYVLLDLGPDRLEAHLRVVDDARRRDAALSTAASFTVVAGTPGLA
ncbi:MAG: alkaline phosphatase D family protein [Burkholderiales bacterium]|nr:alkaline phosphatase D family protein [Burkholderiales bacterium]